MKNSHKAAAILLLFGHGFLPDVSGRAEAEVQAIDPFPVWFESEPPDLYIRVSNTGDEPLTFSRSVLPGSPPKDLVLELKGQREPEYSARDFSPIEFPGGAGDPFAGVPEKKPIGPVVIRPQQAYAVSSQDYPVVRITSHPQLPIRAHFRVSDDRWVSTEWIERKIVPNPELSAPPLFTFKLEARFSEWAVSLFDLGDEKWLFAYVPQKRGTLTRLCRVPKGSSPSSFTHDVERGVNIIRFGPGEPDVILDSRSGCPLSGSERTVPHLHLWKKLSGRPFTDNYQLLMIEGAPGHTGPTPTKDLIRTTVPVAVSPGGAKEQPQSGSGEGPSSSPPGTGPIWAWVVGGAVAVLCAWAGLRAKGRG